jgi:hypothetical protein
MLLNSEHHLSMLHNTFIPHPLATDLPLQTQWFMHAANVVLDFLHGIFDSHIISNRFPDHIACGQNWPLNSPDLNPCDCILWGFPKEKTLKKNPQTVMELRALIIQACNEI